MLLHPKGKLITLWNFPQLQQKQANTPKFFSSLKDQSCPHTHLVNDFLEVNLHGAALDVPVLVRVVDQHRELFGADFLGSVAKDKEEGVDDVGFATAVGADDTGKTLHTEGEKSPSEGNKRCPEPITRSRHSYPSWVSVSEGSARAAQGKSEPKESKPQSWARLSQLLCLTLSSAQAKCRAQPRKSLVGTRKYSLSSDTALKVLQQTKSRGKESFAKLCWQI